MDKVYIDWSGKNGIVTLYNDEIAPKKDRYGTLSEFLDTLREPTEIVLEATFESFNTERRGEFILRCQREGHILKTTPTRQTPYIRKRVFKIEKSDPNDVLSIRHIAKNSPSCLKKPSLSRNEELISRREKANDLLMALRRAEYVTVENGTKTLPGFKPSVRYVKRKDYLAESLVDRLPAFDTLTPTQRIALAPNQTDKTYNLITVAAVAAAAKYARNQNEFDSIAGLSANGYPSQIRSDLHKWNWAGGGRLNEEKKRDDIRMSDWRRELRWLYRQLRPLVDQVEWT